MASAFEKAVASARKGGKKEFSFGGKQYNTKLKGEGAAKKKVASLPKKGPVPAQKPNSGPGRKPTGPQAAAKTVSVAQNADVAKKLREQAASTKTSRAKPAESKPAPTQTAKKFAPNMQRMLAPANVKTASKVTPPASRTMTTAQKATTASRLREQAASQKTDRISATKKAEIASNLRNQAASKKTVRTASLLGLPKRGR